MARHHTNGDAGNAGNAGNAGDAGGAWSFRERSKRSLRRAGRAVHAYLASWRGTVRDGATWHRLRSKWPPSWSQVAVAVAVVAVAAVVGWETCG
ncbi:MAG: hypothetical protein ACLFRX_10040, partial [Gemmatimonadota bacterium]